MTPKTIPKRRERTKTALTLTRNLGQISQPSAKSTIYRSVQDKTPFVVRNKEFVFNVTYNTADVSAFLIPIAPYSCPWLLTVAKNFGSFKFNKFDAHYIPNCSTLTDGNVTIGMGFDMVDYYARIYGGIATAAQNVASNTDNLLASQTPSSMAPCWQGFSVEAPRHQLTEKRVVYSSNDWLVGGTTPIEGNVRNTFSNGYVMAVVYTTAGRPTQTGKVLIDYEIELYSPITENLNA